MDAGLDSSSINSWNSFQIYGTKDAVGLYSAVCGRGFVFGEALLSVGNRVPITELVTASWYLSAGSIYFADILI